MPAHVAYRAQRGTPRSSSGSVGPYSSLTSALTSVPSAYRENVALRRSRKRRRSRCRSGVSATIRRIASWLPSMSTGSSVAARPGRFSVVVRPAGSGAARSPISSRWAVLSRLSTTTETPRNAGTCAPSGDSEPPEPSVNRAATWMPSSSPAPPGDSSGEVGVGAGAVAVCVAGAGTCSVIVTGCSAGAVAVAVSAGVVSGSTKRPSGESSSALPHPASTSAATTRMRGRDRTGTAVVTRRSRTSPRGRAARTPRRRPSSASARRRSARRSRRSPPRAGPRGASRGRPRRSPTRP